MFLILFLLYVFAIEEANNHKRIKHIQNRLDSRQSAYNNFDLLFTFNVSWDFKEKLLRLDSKDGKLELSLNWKYSTTMCSQGKDLRAASKTSETQEQDKKMLMC